MEGREIDGAFIAAILENVGSYIPGKCGIIYTSQCLRMPFSLFSMANTQGYCNRQTDVERGCLKFRKNWNKVMGQTLKYLLSFFLNFTQTIIKDLPANTI